MTQAQTQAQAQAHANIRTALIAAVLLMPSAANIARLEAFICNY